MIIIKTKYEAVIIDKSEFDSQDKTTKLAKFTIMEVDSLKQDIFYMTAEKGKDLEPNPSEIVEIDITGTYLHPKVSTVTKTGKTLKIGVK